MSPKRFSFILAGLIVVTLLIGGVGYYFAISQLSQRTTALKAKLTKSAQAQADLTELGQAKRAYDKSIAPLAPTINDVLPKTKQQTEILAQLQRLAGAQGLTLASVTLPNPVGLPNATSQTTKAGTVLALPISFQLTGSYPQLRQFMTGVETLNRFTNVTTLIVTRPDPAKPITYAITLNAYIKP